MGNKDDGKQCIRMAAEHVGGRVTDKMSISVGEPGCYYKLFFPA